MGSELLSVLALGEARETLASLRRNSRFHQPQDFATAEHPLVEGIKAIKDVVRSGTVCSNKLDAQRVLEPFLEIILSSETNSIITGAALHSVEKIVGRGLDPQQAAGGGACGVISTDSLQRVLRAAANCRFDPTDPARDDVVLSAIARVIAMCLTCGEPSHRLPDADVLLGITTCLKIAANQRNSELLRRSTTSTLTDILSYLLAQLTDQAQRRADDPNEASPADKARFAATLYQCLKDQGIASLSFERAFEGDSRPWSIGCVSSIFIIVSFLLDPKYGAPPTQTALGLSVIHTMLTVTHACGLATKHAELRNLIYCDVSRAIIRSLGSFGQPLSIVSSTFGVAQLLLVVLGTFGGPLLSALWLRILPLYALGRTDSQIIDRETREIGLDALASLFAQKGMISTAYASIDCNTSLLDAVEPLFNALGSAMRENESAMDSVVSAESKKTETDEDDGSEEKILRESRWVALQCADALLIAADCISDRLRISHPSIFASPVTGLHGVGFESVAELLQRKQYKRERTKAVTLFNASQGKRGARGVVVLLRSIENPDSPLITASSAAQDFTDEDIESVVKFFRQTPALSKEAIGLVLSEPDPVSQRVLANYSKDFQFQGRSFTDSIRVFLESFRLPGEAQKIDRIMHSFAQCYFEQTKDGDMTGALVSADAAFVLSFSVVMLNTDQHNSSVKKKMSVDDFIRNNRGINDENDVPREFLEEIFWDIGAEEIRMSNESGVSEMTDMQWSETLRNARASGDTSLVCPNDIKAFDKEIFSCLWKPAVDAALLLLETAADAPAAQRALEGFLSVARSAIAYEITEATDSCTEALCAATGLASGPVEGCISYFGSSIKAQMAMVALFGVVRECGDWIRADGWKSVVACLLRLHMLCLLPQHFEITLGSYGTDFVDLDGSHLPPSRAIPNWWPSYVHPERDARGLDDDSAVSRTSLFSFLSFGLDDNKSLNGRDDRQDIPPHYLTHDKQDRYFADALNLSKKCVAECRVDDVLINETRFFSNEAFESLSAAVNRAAAEVLTLEQLKSQDSRRGSRVISILEDTTQNLTSGVQRSLESLGISGVSPEDDQKTTYFVTAFCIDLLCELTLRNRDRLALIWPITHDLIIKTLAPASSASPILERAVVGLLRIAMRFMHREEVRGDVLRALNLLVKLPSGVAASVGTPLSAGVYQIIKSHSVHISTTSGWHTIMSILESCARFPEPAPSIGFQALEHLINNEDTASQALNPETFAVFLDAVFFYASSALACSVDATDLLHCLANRIVGIHLREDCSEALLDSAEEARHWQEYWSPILLAFSQLCRDDREEVRNQAFALLEQSIRPGGVCESLSVRHKEQVLVEVLLPLSKDIFDPDGTFASKAFIRRRLIDTANCDNQTLPENKARLKAVTIVSRLFLQNIGLFSDQLSSDSLTSLWLGILTCFRDSLAADSGSGPGLRDHLAEMLKNALLVAYSSGMLSPVNEERWTKTQGAVKQHIPKIELLVKKATIEEVLPGAAVEALPTTLRHVLPVTPEEALVATPQGVLLTTAEQVLPPEAEKALLPTAEQVLPSSAAEDSEENKSIPMALSTE